MAATSILPVQSIPCTNAHIGYYKCLFYRVPELDRFIAQKACGCWAIQGTNKRYSLYMQIRYYITTPVVSVPPNNPENYNCRLV
jgi:hypothetical protein